MAFQTDSKLKIQCCQALIVYMACKQEPLQSGSGEHLNFADVDAAMLAAGLLEPMQVDGDVADVTATSTGEVGPPAADANRQQQQPPHPGSRICTTSTETVFAVTGGPQASTVGTPRGDSRAVQFGGEAFGGGGGNPGELAPGQYLAPYPGTEYAAGLDGDAGDSAALLAEVQQQLALQQVIGTYS